ncbi:MAG: DNA double-strand break repair nuclease NurA [Nanoarchaeota archaeon]
MIIENLDSQTLKEIVYSLNNINFELNKEEINENTCNYKNFIAIDGGNNYFNDEILKYFGASLITLAIYSYDFVKTYRFVIFEKIPLKLKRKILNSLPFIKEFFDIDFLLEKLEEKDYNFEKIEEEKSFVLKVRNLLEISALLYYNRQDNIVIRDGSFYLPDLSPIKEELNNKIKDKEKIGALSKNSKLTRNKILINHIDEGIYRVNENIIKKFYNKSNFIFDFPIYLVSFRKKSVYQLETSNKEIINLLKEDSKKGKDGYPYSLIMADKLAKASNSLTKKIEILLLKELYSIDKDLINELKNHIFKIREE